MVSLEHIKLAALDLDGTVLTSDKRVTPRTMAAMENAMDAGVEIAYVTGRPLHGIPEELMKLRGLRYIITSNGAVTYDLKEGCRLRKALLERESALGILQFPELTGLIYSVFINGMGYCDPETFHALVNKHRGGIFEEYVNKSRRGVEDILSFVQNSPEEIENIWISTPDPELRNRIDSKLKRSFPLRTVLTGSTDVEAGHINCDKGLALKELADLLHINMNNVMAIGDNDNDRGMLSESGISVAMGNAIASVKQSVTLITDTNDNDGVAKILESL